MEKSIEEGGRVGEGGLEWEGEEFSSSPLWSGLVLELSEQVRLDERWLGEGREEAEEEAKEETEEE